MSQLSTRFKNTIDEIAGGVTRETKPTWQTESYTTLKGKNSESFCELKFDANVDGYVNQRDSLSLDVGRYLPDRDVDAPTRLRVLILEKALPENKSNPTITKADVLRALQTDEAELAPVPCEISRFENVVPKQENCLIGSIVEYGHSPVIEADSEIWKDCIYHKNWKWSAA